MTTEKQNKVVFHSRLSPEAIRLAQAIADKDGTSRTAVVETAIRALARAQGVK